MIRGRRREMQKMEGVYVFVWMGQLWRQGYLVAYSETFRWLGQQHQECSSWVSPCCVKRWTLWPNKERGESCSVTKPSQNCVAYEFFSLSHNLEAGVKDILHHIQNILLLNNLHYKHQCCYHKKQTCRCTKEKWHAKGGRGRPTSSIMSTPWG